MVSRWLSIIQSEQRNAKTAAAKTLSILLDIKVDGVTVNNDAVTALILEFAELLPDGFES